MAKSLKPKVPARFDCCILLHHHKIEFTQNTLFLCMKKLLMGCDTFSDLSTNYDKKVANHHYF